MNYLLLFFVISSNLYAQNLLCTSSSSQGPTFELTNIDDVYVTIKKNKKSFQNIFITRKEAKAKTLEVTSVCNEFSFHSTYIAFDLDGANLDLQEANYKFALEKDNNSSRAAYLFKTRFVRPSGGFQGSAGSDLFASCYIKDQLEYTCEEN